MQINKSIAIYFSPTRTGAKIAESVAAGCSIKTHETLDVTCGEPPAAVLSGTTLAVVCVPVYGGRVAPVALKRLQALRGQNTPVVACVVYGNRDFGSSIIELSDFLNAHGFITVAVAAFVGEHSYSTPAQPIAEGRPSAADLAEARALGESVVSKLAQGEAETVEARRLRHPRSGWLNLLRFVAFVLKQRRAAKKHPLPPVAPAVDTALCSACGKCAGLCPVNAITAQKPFTADPALCIRCMACVKGCPKSARSLTSPFAPVLAKNFKRAKKNVWLV